MPSPLPQLSQVFHHPQHPLVTFLIIPRYHNLGLVFTPRPDKLPLLKAFLPKQCPEVLPSSAQSPDRSAQPIALRPNPRCTAAEFSARGALA